MQRPGGPGVQGGCGLERRKHVSVRKQARRLRVLSGPPTALPQSIPKPAGATAQYLPSPPPGHSLPDFYKGILNGLPASSPGPHPPGPLGPRFPESASQKSKGHITAPP